jgi:long-subunit acyl-CoA synthetase (AMP-forming)
MQYEPNENSVTHKLTYAELVLRFTAVRDVPLRSVWSLRPGHRVCLVAENCLEWVVCHLACSDAGATVVQIDPALPCADIAELVRRSEAALVLSSRAAFARMVESQGGFFPPAPAAAAAAAGASGAAGAAARHPNPPVLDLEDPELRPFRPEPRRVPPPPDFEGIPPAERPDAGGNDGKGGGGSDPPADKIGALLFTSGTSGVPKGVMLRESSIIFSAEAFIDRFPASESDSTVMILPLHHIFPFMGTVVFLSLGATVTLVREMLPALITGSLEQTRPTFLIFVPRFYELFHTKILDGVRKAGGLKPCLFSCLLPCVGGCIGKAKAFKKVGAVFGGNVRYCISGGAPLSVAVGKAYESWGLPVAEGYGLSESCALVTVNPPTRRKIGSVGTGLPGTELRLGEGNEIQTRGPHVMAGYFRAEDATRSTFTDDNWLRTGDVGQLDAQGYLTIVGRIKELIVTSGGKKVSPFYVEEKYGPIEGAAEFAVFGQRLPGENAEDTEVAAVLDKDHFPKGTSEATMRDAVRAAFNARTGLIEPIYRIHRVHFLDALPLTGSKKVKRNLLSGLCTAAAAKDDSRAGHHKHHGHDHKASGSGGGGGGGGGGDDWDPLTRSIIEIMDPLRPEASRHPIDPSMGLQFVGLDSLGLTNAVGKVAETLDVPMSYMSMIRYASTHSDEAPLNTVADFCTFVRRVRDGEIDLGEQGVDRARLQQVAAGPLRSERGYPATGFQHGCFLAEEGEPKQAYITSRAFQVDLSGNSNNSDSSDNSSNNSNINESSAPASSVDLKALTAALAVLSRRHSSLRTSFAMDETASPPTLMARVHEPGAVPITPEVIRVSSAGAATAAASRAASENFDLTAAPLARVAIIIDGSSPASGPLVVFAIHHLIIDALSWFFFLTDLRMAYSFAVRGEPVVLPAGASERFDMDHFMAHERSAVVEAPGSTAAEHLRYWDTFQRRLSRRHFASPCGYGEPTDQLQFAIDAARARQLDAIAKAHGCSLFAVLFAVYSIVLHEHTREEAGDAARNTVCVHSAYSVRDRAEFATVVGPLISELGLAVDLAETDTFADVLVAARDESQAALRHQEYPYFAALDRYSGGGDPRHVRSSVAEVTGADPFRMRYLLTYYSFANTKLREYDIADLLAGLGGAALSLGGGGDAPVLRPAQLALEKPAGGNDLYLFASDLADGALGISMRFAPAAVPRATAERLAERFQQIATGVTEDGGVLRQVASWRA